MTRRLRPWQLSRVLAITVATLAGALVASTPAMAAGPGKATAATRQVCAGPTKPGEMSCFAIARTDIVGQKGVLAPHLLPNGYGPTELRSAYALPSTTSGAGQTVAIVDAFDNPNAEADLAVYRAQYGLTPCTTANSCFRKVNQNGQSSPLPVPDAGWAAEIALDIDMVSAACPNCNILLVEADSNFDTDLFTAVQTGVALGAKFVSNSYGGSEFAGQTAEDAFFNHQGVAITASSGDFGYGVSYPASSQYVTAVGGTSLVTAANSRGWSETVWSGAGSGCSAFDPKPAFQTDPECARRTVADVSAVADPQTGVAVYNTYQDIGWNVYGGTSVSSPLIASIYALAGAPVAGTYPNSYPYGSPSALYDVTSGSNGSCGGSYLCTAMVGYDGPTGLGTPNGVQAFALPGPHGDIAGTITDASNSQPLASASVSAGTASATTDAQGHYDLALAVGTYDVTAAAYGYQSHTVSGVTVSDGVTTTTNVALTPLPRVTLSGTVTDGSGQGWPLYARLSLNGVPGGPVFTDPVTGHYQISIPSGTTYSMHVTAEYPGYQDATHSVVVGSTDVVHNVPLFVDAVACVARGYAVHVNGVTESFESSTTPAGWSVVNHTAAGGWVFTDNGGRGNLTGGSGGFAIVDSDNLGIGNHEDTELVTPVVNFTGQSSPMVGFNSEYRSFGDSVADVDLSLDSGTTWANVLHQQASVRGPTLIQIPIPQAAGIAGVQVRFHYTGTWAWWWEVDNAFVGSRTCDPVHGGLVLGVVTDTNTGAAVNGATVTSNNAPAETATSMPTPEDPVLSDGFYWMFSSLTGNHPFTASRGGYQSQTRTVNVATSFTTRANFSLGAGHLVITPAAVAKTVKMGSQTTAKVNVKNDGTAPAAVTIAEQDNGFTLLKAQVPGAPLNLVNGTFSPHQLPNGSGKAALPKAVAAATPYAAPWTDIANYPTPIMDNLVGYDAGKVYSVGGTDGFTTFATGSVRDPSTGAWSPIASMTTAREKPSGGFVNGKLYVIGGWDTSGFPVSTLEIYDPVSNTWSTGASVPAAFAGSAASVLGGKLYIVGGCNSSNCGFANVYRYDPVANSWTRLADYPQPTSWGACGALSGQVYCAGGTADSGDTKKGYSYNPVTDLWTPIADLPIDLWAMGYTAAGGGLLVSGGVTNGSSTLTNQGFAFDPGTGTWTAIANSNNTVYRGGSSCGFYKIGGSIGGFNAVANSEVLPGLDQCGTSSDATWLSESTTAFTVAPGATVAVTLTLNGAASVVTQPGDYAAQLVFGTNTPYQFPPVNVTMTVTPPKTWGKVMGTVTGVYCNGTTVALAGATVQIDSWAASYTLKTDINGKYALWLDKRNNPLTMIAAKDGWQPQTKKVKVVAGQTVVVNWPLKIAITCT